MDIGILKALRTASERSLTAFCLGVAVAVSNFPTHEGRSATCWKLFVLQPFEPRHLRLRARDTKDCKQQRCTAQELDQRVIMRRLESFAFVHQQSASCCAALSPGKVLLRDRNAAMRFGLGVESAKHSVFQTRFERAPAKQHQHLGIGNLRTVLWR